MRSSIWTALVLTKYAQTQSIVTICESYSYTATSTFTKYETFYVVDGRGAVQTITPTLLDTSSIGITSTGSLTTSNGVSNGGIGNGRTYSTTRALISENVPGNGTSVIIPDNTIVPTLRITTSLVSRTSSTSEFGVTSSLKSTTSSSVNSVAPSSTESSSSTSASTTAQPTSLTSTLTAPNSSSSTTTSTSATSQSTTSTTATPITISTASVLTSLSASTSTTLILPSTSSSTSAAPIVTNQAYIDTVLRHHNRHRLNHTSDPLTWNPTLAETARKVADSCIYQHDTATDCPPSQSPCYGQNIAAGYLPTQMSFLVSDGFYNSEVKSYTYYGGEPDTNTLSQWGHFSQIVWKIDTVSVGCYSMDCSGRSGGLGFPSGGGGGVRPVFTVCNYGAAGNWIGEFKENVIRPVGLPSIHAGYMCPTLDNCEDWETV